MNSIRGEVVALDTNVFIFALRKEPNYPACETLLFDKLPALQVYMPLQIFLELQRNLTASEMRRVVRALEVFELTGQPISGWQQQGWWGRRDVGADPGFDSIGVSRCLVIDLQPKEHFGNVRFLGRIWVEDQDYNIVRFNGT